jgi:hypothetical protein
VPRWGATPAELVKLLRTRRVAAKLCTSHDAASATACQVVLAEIYAAECGDQAVTGMGAGHGKPGGVGALVLHENTDV